MLKYLFKRLLIFIPTMVAITLVAFVISINAPGDPVEIMLSGDALMGDPRTWPGFTGFLLFPGGPGRTRHPIQDN